MAEDPRELLGAYALGALDDSEREAVERLLVEDEDAWVELSELRRAAASLAQWTGDLGSSRGR